MDPSRKIELLEKRVAKLEREVGLLAIVGLAVLFIALLLAAW